MVAIFKAEQVVVDDAIPTEVPFAISGPAAISGTGSFDVLMWNGVGYSLVETVDVPSLIASQGRYAVTSTSQITVVVTPIGRN